MTVLKASSVLNQIKDGLVVSVQASGNEPLNRPEYLCAMAEAVLQGGACAVRMAQAENIRYFKQKHPDVPVIGITKPHEILSNAASLVYITPTFADVASIAAYAEIVALDATLRPRATGEELEAVVQKTRQAFPSVLLMADIATVEDAENAEKLGFDLIGTTLSGYTEATLEKAKQGPDFTLLEQLVSKLTTPIVMEGRIWAPEEMERAFKIGAFSVVVGSAITRPHEITRRFCQRLRSPS